MKTAARLSKYLNGPGRTPLMNLYYGVKYSRIESDFIVLATIKKSGTNYFRLLFANYINAMYGDGEPVNYKRMVGMFPNERTIYLEDPNSYQAPTELIQQLGYRDFVYQHGTVLLRPFSGPTILLYRNPLDQLVSKYFYAYAYRPDREHSISHPRDLIDREIPHFCWIYRTMKELSQQKNKILITYEDLVTEPKRTLSVVLNAFDFPFEEAVLESAVRNSSASNIRREEIKDGPIHAPSTFTGSFVRSGAIGQWPEFFEGPDLDRIRHAMSECGVDLDSFRLS